MPTPTQTATPYTTGPLAKMCGLIGHIRLPALQVIKYRIPRQIINLYQLLPRHTNAQPNTSANAHIKNWHSRTLQLIKLQYQDRFINSLNLYRETQPVQFFMPTLGPCKCSMTRILQLYYLSFARAHFC